MTPPFPGESARYDYPLTRDSWVMDVGAHKGDFADAINRKYGCTVECYEPIREFISALESRFLRSGRPIFVKPFGLGARTEESDFVVKGDMSGRWADQGKPERVQIRAIHDMMPTPIPGADLLKINIEGGEYDLLESILAHGLAPRFRHIQVQFHFIANLDCEQRLKEIREHLSMTHDCKWATDYVWESWSLK